MSSIQKVRTYVYDTPATYNQFDGGINTNLSNEALEANELRDGLNCHYINQSIVNRRGEKIIKKLLLPINSRPQGDFMFSATNKTYIISVRNGHIFYGEYNESDFEIVMNLLNVTIPKVTARDATDNYFINIKEKTEVDLTTDTEGYIYKYYKYSGQGDTEEHDETVGEDTEEPSEEDYERTLIIQNTKRVQGLSTTLDGETVFIMATGLRILVLKEVPNEEADDFYLQGEVLSAYKPNSWEYQNIGVNNLSPFPNYHISEIQEVPKTSIGQLLTEQREIDLDMESITVTAIVNCLKGYEPTDFYYKWEARVGADREWVPLLYWRASKNEGEKSSKGARSIVITKEKLKELNDSKDLQINDEVYIRCTLTSDFQEGYNVDTKQYYRDEDESGDYIADQAIAQYSKTHIKKTVIENYDASTVKADQEFLKIHSCTKVVSDGYKLLFYDDAYNSCEWFKTVTDKPNYLSYGGNLNFRTNKNEKLIGVVIFDKNIVVFSDNEQLGGNISVVTGNGDDYNDGQYYSPYKRTIVNTNVSCDAYNTIQVAENYIIFKYRKDIYMLDTNDLDAERVQVITINDKVKQKLDTVEFPLDRIREPYKDEHLEYDFHEYSKCLKPDEIFSEVYDGFYGLVFPHQGFHLDTFEYPDDALKFYEGDNQEYIQKLKGRKVENISVKPGLRWKCYFRKGVVYQNGGKTFYPWLRDTSKYLNICNIIHINGESTMVTYNGELVQFNNLDYSGLDEYNYKVRIVTKCYDMELPTLCKFIDNVNIYYNRDFKKNLYLDCFIKNEAGYYLYTPNLEAFINNSVEGGEVKYDERYKIDDALNLLPGYEPMERYENEPYLDPMDKPVQVLNEVLLDTAVLDRPEFTSQTLTPKYRFPLLSAQLILELKSNQAFSLSSLTFSFTSNDMPDFTREKLYRDILKGNILK